MNLLKSYLKRFIRKIKKKKIIQFRPKGNNVCTKNALVYYKTNSLFLRSLAFDSSHTNDSEICNIVDILLKYNYSVTVLDRSIKKNDLINILDKKYSLYIVNGAGNSAPLQNYINEKIHTKSRIFYAAGPEPKLSRKLVNIVHDEFDKRSGIKSIRRRLVMDTETKRKLLNFDAILYMGNQFNKNSYVKYKLPLYKIYPSTNNSIIFNYKSITNKDPKNFVYFGGNGLICKGLDLVLEAFDGLKDVSLDICGPPDEKDFWDYYKPLLKRNSNINFHGFIDVKGKFFNYLMDRSSFNIFPASAEASATSVLTCMRKGVIPVCTKEAGIDIDGFGFYLYQRDVEYIKNRILELSKKKKSEIIKRSIDTYIASHAFTEERFKLSFEKAFLNSCESLKGIDKEI